MSITGVANKVNANVKESYKQLEDLENEANELRRGIEAYEAAKTENHRIATHRAALESERDGLKGEYAEAMFEGDTERLEAAQSRRAAIDAELDSLQPVDTPNVDGVALADVVYRIKQLESIRVNEMLRMLEEELNDLRSRHHDRQVATVVDFEPYITTKDETAVIKKYRPGYKSDEELREEREAARREENLYKYGTETPDFSDTGAITDAMMKMKAKRARQKQPA